MAVLPIRKFGDPVLREKALPVKEIDQSIKELIKNLSDTMREAPGIGLAAPQLGILKRVIAYELGEKLCVYINPEIVWQSEEKAEDEEGCLSFPEVQILINRPERIKVRALTLDGEKVEYLAEGLEARVLQHEIDHLDGILIIDRASAGERKKALRQMSQTQRISSS